jgi:predicted transcriptional regulator
MPLDENAIVNELIAIKRLLVFALMKEGATQSQIAAALGTSQGQISKMFSKVSSGVPDKGR